MIYKGLGLFLHIARDYLENSGFQVLSSGDGREALSIFRREQPNMVVLDLNLPSMNGFDVCNAIEYLAYHPRYGNGRSRSVTLILSDMDDTGSQRDSELQLNSTLSAYGQINGSVGIYFCNQLRIEDWRQRLSRAGIDNFIVESEIVGKPPLPNFE